MRRRKRPCRADAPPRACPFNEVELVAIARRCHSDIQVQTRLGRPQQHPRFRGQLGCHRPNGFAAQVSRTPARVRWIRHENDRPRDFQITKLGRVASTSAMPYFRACETQKAASMFPPQREGMSVTKGGPQELPAPFRQRAFTCVLDTCAHPVARLPSVTLDILSEAATSSYFQAREYHAYYRALKHVDPRRDFHAQTD